MTGGVVTDEVVEQFLNEMDGVFVGTPEALRRAVKRALTLALGEQQDDIG